MLEQSLHTNYNQRQDSDLIFVIYLKTGTGYAWAGHNRVTLWVNGTRIIFMFSSFAKILGLTEPTGSRKDINHEWNCENY